MTIKEIIKQYLEEHGYDGLYSCCVDCACSLDELFGCEYPQPDCTPGYMIPAPKDSGCKYLIVPEKIAEVIFSSYQGQDAKKCS